MANSHASWLKSSVRFSAAVFTILVVGSLQLPVADGAGPRYWIAGDGVWDNTSTFWFPFGPPDATDDVYVGDLSPDVSVTLGISPTVNSLQLSDRARLETATFDLTATSFTNIDDAGTLLVVDSGSTFETADLALRTGGSIHLAGGQLRLFEAGLDFGTIQIDGASELTGWGEIVFADSIAPASRVLDNAGTIGTAQATPFDPRASRVQLTITAPSGGLLDLDGASALEPGKIDLAYRSTLTVNGDLADTFSGRLDMAPASVLNMSDDWSINAGALGAGSIEVNARSSSALFDNTARIEGGHFTARDGALINVNSGTLVVAADFATEDGARINVLDDAAVRFDGFARIEDGQALNLNNDRSELIVGGSLEIVDFSQRFNWDGRGTAAEHATTTVLPDASLFVSVDRFDNSDPYRYDGTLTIDSGDVTVYVDPFGDPTGSTPWVMDRNMQLSNSEDRIPTLSGNQVDIGNNVGAYDADLSVDGNGHSRIVADARFRSDADVTVAAGSTLELTGDVEWAGGRYDGEGVLEAGRRNRVTAATTIGNGSNRLTIDLDRGEWELAEHAGLTLQVAAIDPHNSGFSNRMTIRNGAYLEVDLPGDEEWELENADVSYFGTGSSVPFLSGSAVRLDSRATLDVDGGGDISARIDLAGDVQITGTGTTLTLSGGSLTDANRMTGGVVAGDGTLGIADTAALVGRGTIETDVAGVGNSQLWASGGDLRIEGNVRSIDLIGTADPTGTLDLANNFSTLVASDALQMRGGEVRAPIVYNQLGGRIRAEDPVPSVLAAKQIWMYSGSETQISDAEGELRLQGATLYYAGATTLGPGTLVNELGRSIPSLLTLAHMSQIDTHLRNEDQMQLNGGVGHFFANHFTQTSTGLLNVELGGPTLSNHDFIDLSSGVGTADLDGALAVSLIGGYTPVPGDRFDIIHAPGGVSGEFADPISWPASGLWAIHYDPTLVWLEVLPLMSADFDGNGIVDGDDFLRWQAEFGCTSGCTADADGDGDVDGDDFLEWQVSFLAGSTTGGRSADAVSARVPEPHLWVLGLVALVSLAAIRRPIA